VITNIKTANPKKSHCCFCLVEPAFNFLRKEGMRNPLMVKYPADHDHLDAVILPGEIKTVQRRKIAKILKFADELQKMIQGLAFQIQAKGDRTQTAGRHGCFAGERKTKTDVLLAGQGLKFLRQINELILGRHDIMKHIQIGLALIVVLIAERGIEIQGSRPVHDVLAQTGDPIHGTADAPAEKQKTARQSADHDQENREINEKCFLEINQSW